MKPRASHRLEVPLLAVIQSGAGVAEARPRTLFGIGEYARLVEAARSDPHACLIALLGGEAGLCCGEMMALEWTDVDFNTRQYLHALLRARPVDSVPSAQRTMDTKNMR